MTAVVAQRRDTMPGFNSSLDMDTVHTPARYIALFSITTGGLSVFELHVVRTQMYFSFLLLSTTPASAMANRKDFDPRTRTGPIYCRRGATLLATLLQDIHNGLDHRIVSEIQACRAAQMDTQKKHYIETSSLIGKYRPRET